MSNRAVAEINLADPDFWLREDCDDAIALLREAAPIAWHEHPECGRGWWSFVDTEDIRHVSRNWPEFTNRYGVRVHYDPEQGRVVPGTGAMITMDPPEHTALRGKVSAGFTPKQVAQMEERIEVRTSEVLSQLRAGTEIDFVSEVASTIPSAIICDILGVHLADRARLVSEVEKSFGEQDPDYGYDGEEGSRAMVRVREYGARLVEERRAEPGDDMMSALATSMVHDRYLTDDELAGYFAILLAGGMETTRTALTHAIVAFCDFPDQRELFINETEAYGNSAVDEILRWATPVREQKRVLTADLEYKGVHLKKGDKVALWYSAANRDPAVFPDPFRFDITRSPNPHVSFGAGGIHFCLGASLARREILVILRDLLSRFPDLALAARPVPLRSMHVNGIKSLRVRL